ncbi:signal peptidase II [Streptomyces sp. NPDC054933]
MTKAERTIGTPGFEQAAGKPADGEDAQASPAADTAGTGGTAEPDAAPGGATDVPAPRRKRRIVVLFGVAALAYALDLISKTLVVQHLENQPSIQLIGHYLQFEAIRNSGAAFGIGQGMTVVFTLIALIVIGVIARLARKLYSAPWAVALGLLLGGALGNLTDRIFRSPGVFQGGVVDFIAPAHFAVFNLADSAIVCGGILIVWLSFRGLDPDGTVHRD